MRKETGKKEDKRKEIRKGRMKEDLLVRGEEDPVGTHFLSWFPLMVASLLRTVCSTFLYYCLKSARQFCVYLSSSQRTIYFQKPTPIPGIRQL